MPAVTGGHCLGQTKYQDRVTYTKEPQHQPQTKLLSDPRKGKEMTMQLPRQAWLSLTLLERNLNLTNQVTVLLFCLPFPASLPTFFCP